MALKSGATNFQGSTLNVGNNTVLSEGDIAALNSMY
jgi:hypothetical protein